MDTDHFTLISNAGQRDTVRLGEQVERLRQVLATIASDMRVRSAIPTKIFVFRNEASFRPYKMGTDGRPRNVSGYFVGLPDGNFVALDASAGQAPFTVVFHEFVHQWLQTNVPGIPLWLDEGLAEFYSTFQSDHQSADIGRHIDRHVLWLRDNPLIPLAELFEIDRRSPDYNEGIRQGTIYAESWALVHMLMAGDPSLRPKVSGFAFQVAAGRDPVVAFEETMGMSLLEAERELKGYVHRAAFNYYRFQFRGPLGGGGELVRDIPRSDVLAELGELLVRSGGPELSALEHLEEALAVDPENADAWSTLGLLRAVQGDRVSGERWLRRAVELEPDNARSRWLLGQALFDRFQIERGDAEGEGSDPLDTLRAARAQFAAVLELEPENIPARVGFGMSWVFDEEPARGIEALEGAWRSVPQRPDVLVGLISAYAVAGQSVEARGLLERHLRGYGRDQLTRAAESAVAYAEVNRALDDFYSGDRDGGLALLEAALNVTRDAALKEMLIERRAELRLEWKRLADLDAFEAALELARQGDLEASAEALEALRALPLDRDLSEKVDAALSQVEEEGARAESIAEFNRGVRLARGGDLEQAKGIFERLQSSPFPAELREALEKALVQVEEALQ